MKKVVMFAGPHYEIPPTKGAAIETWIYEVAKRLITYQPHILSIAHEFMPIKEYKNGVFFHRIKIGTFYKRLFQKILGWDFLSYNKRIIKIIKDLRPSIVHIHNYYEAHEIIVAIRNFDPSIIIILHMHNENPHFHKEITFPNVDLFIGCSQYIIECYKDKVYSKKFHVIYNGVDVPKYTLPPSYKEQLRQLLQKGEHQKNIFYFGRISIEKGVDKFIKLASLYKDNPLFQFYCVGAMATKGDRLTYYQTLKSEIEQNNLQNIHFLDYIAPDKMHYAYQMADLIIIPSRFEEPFCMVAIEAMASKIPIISVFKGGLKEYLNENNSFVITNYDYFTNEAKLKIDFLFNSTQSVKPLENILNNAYKTVSSNFDWIHIAASVEKVYNEHSIF